MELPLITFIKDIEDNPDSTWSAKLISANVGLISANFGSVPVSVLWSLLVLQEKTACSQPCERGSTDELCVALISPFEPSHPHAVESEKW